MKGFTKCDNNILFSNELDAISKLVYTSINFYTRNGVGECFAKKTTLARMLNISTYQLRKSLNQLEHLQLIHIERPGQGHPDTITLMDGKPRSKDISHHTPSLLYKEDNYSFLLHDILARTASKTQLLAFLKVFGSPTSHH